MATRGAALAADLGVGQTEAQKPSRARPCIIVLSVSFKEERMRNLFSLFYAVLFGALLSAEIGSYHRLNLNATKTVPEWASRVALLVVARALWFAWAYVTLPIDLSPRPSRAFTQVVLALLLCGPVIGFQHLSYLLVTPADFGTGPSALGPRSTAAWWTTALATVLMIMIFGVWASLK
jgi:hypothetical protein